MGIHIDRIAKNDQLKIGVRSTILMLTLSRRNSWISLITTPIQRVKEKLKLIFSQSFSSSR